MSWPDPPHLWNLRKPLSMYDDLIANKGQGNSYDNLVPLSADDAKALRTAFPGVPQDYVEFLEKIGFGELGESSYMLYSGPVESAEVYGESLDQIQGILVIEDDFQGFNAGFDVSRGGEIVEIDPTDLSTRVIAPNFEGFIRNKIAALG